MSDDLEDRRRAGAAKLDAAAREKRAREEERDAERREEDEKRVRLSVGRYRYRAIRNAVYFASLPGLPAFGIAIGLLSFDVLPSDVGVGLVWGSGLWLFGGLSLWSSGIAWRASRSAMREEQQWSESRPFEIRGYFEWLERYVSSDGATMHLAISGPDVRERANDLKMLVASVHSNVTLEKERFDGPIRLTLSGIGERDDDQRVRVMHELVDRVFVPLHAETPIQTISIEKH